MIGWGLILYYLALFVLPGHEWLWWNAVELLPVRLPQPVAYAVAVALTLALCMGISWMVIRILQGDDARWTPYAESTRASGWIGFADAVLLFAAVGGVGYSAYRGLALYGVLAAGLPIVLLAIGARAKPSKEDEGTPNGNDEVTSTPAPLAQVSYERLEREAEMHLVPNERRDTEFHSHWFWPPATAKSGKFRPKPYTVSWVVSREENLAALRESPQRRFGTSTSELQEAIEVSAQQRSVQFLAEQVAGGPDAAAEVRIERIACFLDEAIAPAPDGASQRLPVTMLAEARATDQERTVCLISMILGLGIPVALWTRGADFGAAIRDLPAGALGIRHEARTAEGRYSLYRAVSSDVQIVGLRPPPTAGRKPPQIGQHILL